MTLSATPVNVVPPGRVPTPVAGVTRQIFGISIHAMTMAQSVVVCDQAIRHRKNLMIGVVNAAKIVNMRRMPLLGKAVIQSDLVLSDGMSIVWASRILRRPLPERVAGIDLFANLLQLANERGYAIFLLGATQQILDRLVVRISSQFPNIQIAGSHNGYFSDAENDKIATQIRDAKPDMLFLGMTSPKKEVFLARWDAYMNVAVCHGVGGSFDVLSGQTKRAPATWQNLGLEWLYRVVQEPSGMWKRYLVTNILFLFLLLREIFHASPPLVPRVAPEADRT